MESYSIYFAGSLFNLRELAGNVLLANAIERVSGGRYHCILPQDLEQRECTAHSIRDQDIKSVLEADLILANYDGTELDSGTVVEYMIAKFADIPAVIVRSDFRPAGDQGIGGDPWNLMSSFFPNSASVTFDSMDIYKKFGVEKSSEFGAKMVIDAFDELLQSSRPLSQGDGGIQVSIYNWINAFTGFENPYEQDEITEIIERKRLKGLL